jgi:hypothetical protein
LLLPTRGKRKRRERKEKGEGERPINAKNFNADYL